MPEEEGHLSLFGNILSSCSRDPSNEGSFCFSNFLLSSLPLPCPSNHQSCFPKSHPSLLFLHLRNPFSFSLLLHLFLRKIFVGGLDWATTDGKNIRTQKTSSNPLKTSLSRNQSYQLPPPFFFSPFVLQKTSKSISNSGERSIM